MAESDDPKSGLPCGFYPEGYNPQSPIYIPTPMYLPTGIYPDPDIIQPTCDVPTTTTSNNAQDYSTSLVSPAYYPVMMRPSVSDVPAATANNAQAPPPPSTTTTPKVVPTTTSCNNAEDETPFYSTCCVSPAYYAMMMRPLEDEPAATANNVQGPPPPSATTTLKAFEMQAQAYNSQQHNHQCGEGEEQPMKKPSSSGAVPSMPRGLGCVEVQPRIPDPFSIDVLSDFTVEERKIYNKIVCESDGFDCPYVRPEILVPGLLKPYPLENIPDVERMEFDYMADLALKHYNDLNGSSYQLVEVIKATMRYSAGLVYNITLRAKDDKSGSPPQNFQARMYDTMDKYKVLFCRVEGNAEPKPIGDSDKRPGCWVPKPLIFQ